MHRRLPALLVAAVVSLLTLAAVAQAASSISFLGAGGGARVRPRSLYLSADGTLVVDHVAWRSWGGRTAVGDGTADSHGCTPDCAAGHNHSQAVSVTLSHPVVCRGRSYYDDVALRDRRTGRALFTSDLKLDHWAPCRQ